MSDSDLNSLTIPPSAAGHYGVDDPDNGWPGHGEKVYVTHIVKDGAAYQIGHTEGEPGLWGRSKSLTGGEWGEWAEVGLVPPPEVPETPEDTRKDSRR